MIRSTARTVHLPDGRGERLEWYRFFVHNRSVIGSLFTLVHLPFMLSFLSLALIGAAAGGMVDIVVLILSLVVVASLLYGEHMLDETTMVGKPWNTVLGDGELVGIAAALFILSLIIASYASLHYETWLPMAGVIAGVLFSILYGLEVKGFHSVGFGGIGMGAVAPFSYLAQTMMLGRAWEPLVAVVLLVFGCCYGYVLLSLYESTKTHDHHFFWRTLAFHFVSIYALAAVTVAMAA